MKMMDFNVIFCRVGRLNGPTPEPNVIELVEIQLLFIRRVNGFNRFGLIGLTGGSNIGIALM